MFFVLGYGNTLRGDDAAGVEVANRLLDKKLAGVKVVTSHQLQLEFLEEAIKYKKVILVDASSQGRDVSLSKVEPTLTAANSSHWFSPQLFCELARTIYPVELDCYLCSIPGESFELGKNISEAVRSRIDQAVALILDFIQKEK